MRSSINLFLVGCLVVLSVDPKNMRMLLLSSCVETKLFEFRFFSQGYLTFLGDSHLQDTEIALTKEATDSEIALTKEAKYSDIKLTEETNKAVQTDALRSAGVVLYSHPILFLDPNTKKVPSFSTMFAFSIRNVHGDRKAFGDGLAFLISADNNLLGSPGYLGLVDSADLTRNKFIAIEFDTKRDSMFQDPDDNHIGLDINSLFSVKLATSSSLGVDLKSGDIVFSWIDYKSNEKRLEVFLSDSYMKPKKSLLNVGIDLSDYLKGSMFVGFSAATDGGNTQSTYIEQWEFTIISAPSPPPPSSPELVRSFSSPSESGRRHLTGFAIGLVVGVCSTPFALLFCWFCWKKFMGMIQISEGTDDLETQTIRSRGISCQESLLSILVYEIARRLNAEKVLNKEAELIHVKTLQSSIPLSNSSSAVKPFSHFETICHGEQMT